LQEVFLSRFQYERVRVQGIAANCGKH